MRLFRTVPKTKNSNIARNQAVSVTLNLILSSYVVALVVVFGLPYLFSLLLAKELPEHIKAFIDIMAGALVSFFFVKWSWDQISATVGAAIDAAVAEKIESEISPYKRELENRREELDNYKRMNSLEEIIKRQNQEFYSAIPNYSRVGKDGSVEIYTDELLHRAFRRRVARDSIIRGLAYEEDLIVEMALSASKRALKKTNLSFTEATKDIELQIFRQDIYVYLKAWLVLSIANEREMEVEIIKQRCSGKQKQYIDALQDIRDRLLKKTEVTSCLDNKYREDAVCLIEEYLNKLIVALEKIANKTSTS